MLERIEGLAGLARREQATVEVPPRWRHRKRGSTYRQVCLASLQASSPCEESAVLVVYQGEDGRYWARPHDEFHDGRFEDISEGPGPIDLVERTRPTPPPPVDEYGPATAIVIACVSIGLGGALACIAAAMWLLSHLPTVQECPL